MKTIRILTACMLLCTLIFQQACNDEESLNLNLTEVKNLYTPTDNLSIALQPAQGFTEMFQWDKAYAEDGSLVLYEIAFDQEGGDFTNPFYRQSSDGKGVETQLTLTHADLNQIAKLGGAAFFEKKKFRWTVMASKGSNIKTAAQTRVIELERPGGFEVLPGALYLTGNATEGGTDVSKAGVFAQTAPGKFEIYSRLKAGTYKFMDGTGAGARTFFVDNTSGTPVINTDGETTYSGADKVYRISVDFNSLATKTDEVKSVGFFYCQENKIIYDLSYAGGGIFSVTDVTVNLTAVSYGLEERHKYRVVLNNGTEDFEEWWGYEKSDSPGQDGKYGNIPAEYLRAFKIASNNQWDYSWKLDRPAINGKKADFILSFRGTEAYHMNYIIH